MTQTYYRVQSSDRDPADLLDPGYQYSHAWSGGPGHTRQGVSVCDSVEDLALYLASHGSGIPVREDWVIVELEADTIPGAKPCDPEMESLVRPTAIVSVRPAGVGYLAAIAEADAFLASLGAGPEFDDDEE